MYVWRVWLLLMTTRTWSSQDHSTQIRSLSGRWMRELYPVNWQMGRGEQRTSMHHCTLHLASPLSHTSTFHLVSFATLHLDSIPHSILSSHLMHSSRSHIVPPTLGVLCSIQPDRSDSADGVHGQADVWLLQAEQNSYWTANPGYFELGACMHGCLWYIYQM